MDEFLNYVDSNPIGVMMGITIFIALIISNIISITAFISFKKKHSIKKSIINIGDVVNTHDIDTIKTVIYQVYNNFLEKEYIIEKEYNKKIESIGKNTIYNVVQNMLITYGKNASDSVDENELFKNQDLLELYLTRDLNRIIFSKLEGISNLPSLQGSDDFELNNKIETFSHEIIDSLILGIKGYNLITQPLSYLEKALEDSSRPLFDEVRKSVKSYIELNRNKQKEKLELARTRNDIIDKQILLLIGEK